MTKHILDQPRQEAGQRMARFLRMSRTASHGQAVRVIGARPRTQSVARVSAYLRIARGAA